jgi:very-short-patch-repair endonuclease
MIRGHAHKSIHSKSPAGLELFARQHRSCLTESEARLWSAINARQLGVSFRRQVPVAGQFIADFCAASIGLSVEVDGAIHARKLGADARRELKLRRAGFPMSVRELAEKSTVSRFWPTNNIRIRSVEPLLEGSVC